MQNGSGTAPALPPIAVAATTVALRLLDEVDLRLRPRPSPPCKVRGRSPFALEDHVLAAEHNVICAKTVVALRAPEALEKDAWRMLQIGFHDAHLTSPTIAFRMTAV